MTINHNEGSDRSPTFFIAGAPKCGTTALNEYLKSHPNIFMASKESNFFATDFLGRGVNNYEEYIKLFNRNLDVHYMLGEASVWYMYSTEAVRNIYKFNHTAKIILMLRNPVDMIYSLHSELLWNFDEDEKDFAMAWALQEKRKNGHSLPKHVVNPDFLQYAEVGKLGMQVERLLNIFPAEQVKLILFDDFKASTKKVYEEVLSFLGVPQDGRADFPKINLNKRCRFNWLGKFMQRPPNFLVKTIRNIKYCLGLEQFWFVEALHKLNMKIQARKPLDQGVRREMLREFSKDIDKLSNILKRDLSCWKKI